MNKHFITSGYFVTIIVTVILMAGIPVLCPAEEPPLIRYAREDNIRKVIELPEGNESKHKRNRRQHGPLVRCRSGHGWED